jgi:hypothetical protein
MMDLETALAYVRAREKVRRRSWRLQRKYLCLGCKPDGTLFFGEYEGDSLKGEYRATPEDFGAYDWERVSTSIRKSAKSTRPRQTCALA